MNHFANPADSPGGTRLIELTDRLVGWDTTIVAACRNLFTRTNQHSDRASFKTVWTTSYTDNGLPRLINWVTYTIAMLFFHIGGFLILYALMRLQAVIPFFNPADQSAVAEGEDRHVVLAHPRPSDRSISP